MNVNAYSSFPYQNRNNYINNNNVSPHSSHSTSSSNSTYLGPIKYEVSQVYEETINRVWNLFKTNDGIASFIKKSISFLNLPSEVDLNITSSITQSIDYKKVIIYTSSSLSTTFTFTLLSNTLEDTTLFTICASSKNCSFINEQALAQICSSILQSIVNHLSNNFEDIKHYESTIIKTSMINLWNLITKWEYDKISDFMYSNINLHGDPLKVGTEVNLVCDNEYNCSVKIEGIEDQKESNTWRYIVKPLECRNNTHEIRISLVKVTDEVTFFSFENLFKFKITKETEEYLTKMKMKFFREIKKHFEKNPLQL